MKHKKVFAVLMSILLIFLLTAIAMNLILPRELPFLLGRQGPSEMKEYVMRNQELIDNAVEEMQSAAHEIESENDNIRVTELTVMKSRDADGNDMLHLITDYTDAAGSNEFTVEDLPETFNGESVKKLIKKHFVSCIILTRTGNIEFALDTGSYRGFYYEPSGLPKNIFIHGELQGADTDGVWFYSDESGNYYETSYLLNHYYYYFYRYG